VLLRSCPMTLWPVFDESNGCSAVLWDSCAPSAKLEAVDVLFLNCVRCVYNSLLGSPISIVIRCGVQLHIIRRGCYYCPSCSVEVAVYVVARVLFESVMKSVRKGIILSTESTNRMQQLSFTFGAW
jgi:hypothetical protein